MGDVSNQSLNGSGLFSITTVKVPAIPQHHIQDKRTKLDHPSMLKTKVPSLSVDAQFYKMIIDLKLSVTLRLPLIGNIIFYEIPHSARFTGCSASPLRTNTVGTTLRHRVFDRFTVIITTPKRNYATNLSKQIGNWYGSEDFSWWLKAMDR